MKQLKKISFSEVINKRKEKAAEKIKADSIGKKAEQQKSNEKKK